MSKPNRQIARVLAERLRPFFTTPHIEERLAFLEAKERQLAQVLDEEVTIVASG